MSAITSQFHRGSVAAGTGSRPTRDFHGPSPTASSGRRWLLRLGIAWFAAIALSASATVYDWTGAGGDGSWHNAGNWAPAGVPSAADDVRLGLPAGGKTLTITNDVEIRGFTNTRPVLLEVRRADLLVQGEVDFQESFRLHVTAGRTTWVRIGQLTSRGLPRSDVQLLEGSEGSFPNLTEIFTTGSQGWGFEARSESSLDFPALTRVVGPSYFWASGTNSTIRLPELHTASGVTVGGSHGFVADEGGAVLMSKLTVARGSGARLAAGSSMDLVQLREFVGANAWLELQSQDLVFTNLVSLDGTALRISGGSRVILPKVTEWITDGRYSDVNVSESSLLDLPNLVDLSAIGGRIGIQAYSQSRVLMPRLAAAYGGIFAMHCGTSQGGLDHTGSEIVCDQLRVIESANSGGGSLMAAQGGALRLPRIEALDGCSVTVESGLIEIATVARFTRSTFETLGVGMTFGSLTNADSSSFSADGVRVDLPALRKMDGGTGQARFFVQNRGRVTLPALVELTGTSLLDIYSGGSVEAPALAMIRGYSRCSSCGEGSQLLLPALAAFDGEGGYILGCDLGVVRMGQVSGTVSVNNADVVVHRDLVNGRAGLGEGAIEVPRLVLGPKAGLHGRGRIVGNVTAGGPVGAAWGGHPVTPDRPLVIEGDLELVSSARVEASVFSEAQQPRPTRHVQIDVLGTASLGGAQLVLAPWTRPVAVGDTFNLLRMAHRVGKFREDFRGLGNGGSLELKPSYTDPNHFVMTPEAAAAPAIVANQPLNEAYGGLDFVTVEFSESVAAETFETGDVVITAPGNQSVAVRAVAPEAGFAPGGPRFRIQFQTQTNLGPYRVQVGPEVRDFANLPMAAPFSWTFDLRAAGPQLAIKIDGDGFVLCWPAGEAEGYVVEFNEDLGNPAGWRLVDAPVSTEDGVNSISLPRLGGVGFYRLRRA